MRSFVKEAAPSSAALATQPENPTAVAAPPAPATMTVAPRTHGSFVSGDVDKSDIKTPYLSCVQAVGPKSQLFTPGTLVLGETAITQAPATGQPTGKIRLMFLNVAKTFVENLPYNTAAGAPRPRVWHKLSEVTAAGLSSTWVGNTPPGAIPKTTCFALVRQPEALEDGQFNIIADAKTYAPAMISFQKTSYSAAKTLWTDLSLSLKNDPTATFYDLFWVRELRGPNYVWVAKLQRVRDEAPTADIRAIASKLAGGNLSYEEDSATE